MRLPIPLPGPESGDADFVALGECSLDYIGVVQSWPAPDEKHALSGLAIAAGGQAATAALACRRLGWRTRFVGSVGDDGAGAAALDPARAAGVDVRVVVRRGTETRQAIVLVESASGARTVLEQRAAALSLRSGEVPAVWVSTGRLLLVDTSSVEVSIEAAQVARRRGIPVMVDIEGRTEQADALLSLVDLLIVAEAAVPSLVGTSETGVGLRRLAASCPAPLVVVTLGRHGSLALCGGKEFRTKPPVVEVVDTTGAGDAFRGGLAAGWLRLGTGADLGAVLTYANAVAALSCRGVGAQGGLPTGLEVEGIL
jgi:sugar/nucleoside kinase (ribokinase family)